MSIGCIGDDEALTDVIHIHIPIRIAVAAQLHSRTPQSRNVQSSLLNSLIDRHSIQACRLLDVPKMRVASLRVEGLRGEILGPEVGVNAVTGGLELRARFPNGRKPAIPRRNFLGTGRVSGSPPTGWAASSAAEMAAQESSTAAGVDDGDAVREIEWEEWVEEKAVDFAECGDGFLLLSLLLFGFLLLLLLLWRTGSSPGTPFGPIVNGVTIPGKANGTSAATAGSPKIRMPAPAAPTSTGTTVCFVPPGLVVVTTVLAVQAEL